MTVGLLKTRLAPSPTGALHLGNARTFLINWALARRENTHILLRIEDLDSPRVKQGSDRQAIDILNWLGLDWDSGPLYQSSDLTPYSDAMHQLARAALTYPSPQTRGEIDTAAAAAASAPQEGAHETPFPALLRPADISPRDFDDTNTNWRLVVHPGDVAFHDDLAGPQRFDVSRIVGDFLLWTRRGVPAYQLAVVIDDARQGITQITRGDDLLDSTARQILVARVLDLSTYNPRFLHLPLVRGPDGKRLAKRHGDTRLATYRAAGITPQRIIGLLAAWSGILPRHTPTAMSAAEFLVRLDPTRIPRDSITMTPEDAQWLQADAPSR